MSGVAGVAGVAVGPGPIISVEAIARMTYEANRVYCEQLGETPLPWEDAKEGVILGVRFALAHPEVSAEELHVNWCKDKLRAGWVYGVKRDPEAKTHPCLVPYAELPSEQRVKDHLFRAIVRAMVG